MLEDKDYIRYNRQLLLNEVGIEGQQRLKSASVLVIGVGGLGCPALEYLAGAGIGKIGIVDFDLVEETNLHRQLIYSPTDIGRPKVLAAKCYLEQRNNNVEIITYQLRVEASNVAELILPYDIVVDCTDSFEAKYIINDSCYLLKKPLVFGAIHKFQGQVSVFHLKTQVLGNPVTYRCLFPNPPNEGTIPTCNEVGVIGIVPGLIGILQATEAIKIILDIGKVLAGKLLIVDLLQMDFFTTSVKYNANNIAIGPKTLDELVIYPYAIFCGRMISSVHEVTAKELVEMISGHPEHIQLIDVRELNEEPILAELETLRIPSSEICNNVSIIDRTKTVIIFCQTGKRSKLAIQRLQIDNGFKNLVSLEGGVLSLVSLLDEQ